MAQLIRGKPPLRQRIDFELRYDFGYTYLDRCGRIINTILRERPDWALRNTDPNPQSAPLVNLDNSCIFNFSTFRIDLHLERPLDGDALNDDQIGVFARQVEDLSAVVVDQLELEDFKRIGCRIAYLFPFASEEEAVKWVLELGLFKIPSNLATAFEGRLLDTDFVAVLEGQDRRYRLALDTVSRSVPLNIGEGILNLAPHRLSKDQNKRLLEREKARKFSEAHPPFAVKLDIDAYQEEPKIIRAGEFVRTSHEEGLRRFATAVTANREER